MFEFPWQNSYDFIFADFNNFTFRRYLTEYKQVVDNIFAKAD
jgi:hypothetical protein